MNTGEIPRKVTRLKLEGDTTDLLPDYMEVARFRGKLVVEYPNLRFSEYVNIAAMAVNMLRRSPINKQHLRICGHRSRSPFDMLTHSNTRRADPF